MPTLTLTPKPSLVDLSTLMERIPGMVALYDVGTGKYLFVNQAVSSLLGYQPEDFVSGGIEFVTSLVHPDDLKHVLEKNKAALSKANISQPFLTGNEPIVSFEYRVRHSNGRWVWVHTQGSVYSRNTRGKVDKIMNISIDITERKNAEEKLLKFSKELEHRVAQNAERLELAMEASKIGIWEWNIENGDLIWSPEMLRLYGMNPKKDIITYEKFMAALHVDDRGKKQKLLMQAAETGRPYQVEHRCVWPDGSLHWILGKGKAFMKDGKAYRMIGTAMNIDDRKNAEKLKSKTVVLKAQRKELMELNKSKDDFISMASHQLRTPATGVKQYVGMLLNDYAGKPTPKQRTLLKKAYESNERQIKIVNDLLLVAKVDAGKVTLDKCRCDLTHLIRDVAREQSPDVKLRDQKIATNIPKKLPAVIDAFYLRTVLENLLNNASKYSPAGTLIKVNARIKAKKILIDIIDQGIGISAKDQTKLYRKFTRIHNDKAEAVDGNGLGLYWSKKIIDLHNGNLSLSSKLNHGSTFTITLPSE